jgi:hypothetical protein
MQTDFGSHPQLSGCHGSAIRRCCYEVGEEVKAFTKEFERTERFFPKRQAARRLSQFPVRRSRRGLSQPALDAGLAAAADSHRWALHRVRQGSFLLPSGRCRSSWAYDVGDRNRWLELTLGEWTSLPLSSAGGVPRSPSNRLRARRPRSQYVQPAYLRVIASMPPCGTAWRISARLAK